jgi:hypothetical protein
MLFTIRISGITTIFERKNYKLLIFNGLKNRFYKLFFSFYNINLTDFHIFLFVICEKNIIFAL